MIFKRIFLSSLYSKVSSNVFVTYYKIKGGKKTVNINYIIYFMIFITISII